MTLFQNTAGIVQPRGKGLLSIFFFLFLIILLLFLGDMAFIFTSEKCIDKGLVECALGIVEDDEDEPAEGAVTATGSISGEFKGEDHTVTISMSFPLEGGAVTGSFSGDCDGSITGTYAGGEGGAISGKGSGSCAFVVPVSGSFSGVVNQSGKTVPINGTGGALGITKSGSVTLTY